MCFSGGVTGKQQRLSDPIGPYRGTYRIVFRVLQPLLEASKFVVLLLVGALRAALGTAQFHNTESRSASAVPSVYERTASERVLLCSVFCYDVWSASCNWACNQWKPICIKLKT